MNDKTFFQRLSSFDIYLSILLAVTLVVIGYFAFGANPDIHRRYVAALLQFSVADSLLTEDLYRLQSGSLNHLDGLVSNQQELRRAELQLSRLPSHVQDSPELNRLVTQLSTLANQKVGLVEDFKTSVTALNARLDNLAELAEELEDSTEGARLPRGLVTETVNNLLVLVRETSPHNLEVAQSKLASLTEYLGEPTAVANAEPSPLQQFTRHVDGIVTGRQEAARQLQDLTAIPLSSAAAQLSYTYHRSHQRYRLGSVAIMSGVLAAMIIFFVVLTYVTRWRSFQKEAEIEVQQQTLAGALKEARDQSDTLLRGEAKEAATLAEERSVALLRHTFETIAIISREENYIFLSPAVSTMLGLSEKELIGKSVYEGIHADDLIRVKDYLTRAQKELQTDQTITYRLMDARGKWHMVETFASNQYSNPAIRGMVLNTRKLESTPVPS